jgi:carbamoyltransferase
VFEESLTHILLDLHRRSGLDSLVVAGGSAMNSVYNGKIASVTPFKNVFIPPFPDDTGVSVGAALAAFYQREKPKRDFQPELSYLGPSFDSAEIGRTLKAYNIKAEQCDDIAARTAQLLHNGKLVGWFQGRMEFGQRALGNRSILADPRVAEVKDKINAAVKFREAFRPFAPAILEERATDYFDMPPGTTVPFMEKVFPVRKERRADIPAVVFVDGTGRLQTVSRNSNPRFHDLISKFAGLTGVPVVLNTSFNLNGEPIVCSPTDAIRTFYSCGLDALVLEDWLIQKEPT